MRGSVTGGSGSITVSTGGLSSTAASGGAPVSARRISVVVAVPGPIADQVGRLHRLRRSRARQDKSDDQQSEQSHPTSQYDVPPENEVRGKTSTLIGLKQ